MFSSRNFLSNTLLTSATLLAVWAPVQAQTQVATEGTTVHQGPTRPPVFKESNALSGYKTQHWGNDRESSRDRYPDRDRGRDQHHDHIPSACAPGTNTVIVPVYPGYTPYPTYGVPAYPYGSSVTVSTPGYNDGTFNVFPWSTTVTTFGAAPVVPDYYGYRNYPSYPVYPSYPAYPTYVPGNIQGYRGAATPGYVYNGGSFPSGAFITGSTNGYSSGFSAGFSNGSTSIVIGGRR